VPGVTSKIHRDTAPDVLRGFALLGILVVNIQFMGLNSDQGARGEWTQGFANGSATFLIAALFAGKFYLLFSFLFGYSSNYVISNDKSNRARWVKRCFVLVALGALHFTFLWHGDIIFLYGLFGLLLTFFFFRADRTLKIWSRIVFSVSTFFIVLIGSLAFIAEYLLEEDLGLSTVSSLDEILQNGTFLDSIPARLEVWALSISLGIFLQDANSRLMKKGLVLGLPIQVIAAVILLQNEQAAKPSESIYLVALFISFVTAPLLSMFYVGVIRKLVEEKPHLVLWMMPAGKMSLTIYISQSVVTSLIFGPWGLGLFQALQTWQVFFLAFAIWLILSYLAAQWLKKFNQGPLEKLVSSLTRNR